MNGWHANTQRTCAQPVVLGLRPKLKYHPYAGGYFLYRETRATVSLAGEFWVFSFVNKYYKKFHENDFFLSRYQNVTANVTIGCYN